MQLLTLRKDILALLPIGLLLYSISSNFCACIFTWSCSTRTELVQKWSLLVRIRTLVDRISICFFEPGDLLFRSDSGQMEEDLDAAQHVQLNQIIFAQEDLLEQHAQPDILLITARLLIYKWRHLPPLRSLASCVDGDAWVFIARSLELTAIKLSLSSPLNYYQATFYYSSSKRRKHVKYIQTYWLKFQWRISNWFQYVKCKKKTARLFEIKNTDINYFTYLQIVCYLTQLWFNFEPDEICKFKQFLIWI